MIHLYIAKNLYCKYCDLAEKLIKKYHVRLKVIKMNETEWEYMRNKTGKKVFLMFLQVMVILLVDMKI